MTEIDYIKGDATKPIGDGNKIIVHVCNDIGGWGRGFVVAISNRWPEPEKAFRDWYKDGDEPFELGQVQFVRVETDLWVANLIGQRDIRKKDSVSPVPPVRYAAIEEGLTKVAAFAKENNASIHMPRIGCGLAGGKWDIVEGIIERTLAAEGVPVTVYDFG